MLCNDLPKNKHKNPLISLSLSLSPCLLSVCVYGCVWIALSLSLSFSGCVYVFMPGHKELNLSLSLMWVYMFMPVEKSTLSLLVCSCFCMHYAVNYIPGHALYGLRNSYQTCSCKGLINDCCIHRESTVEVQNLLDKILCIWGGTLLHHLVVWNLVVWIIVVS